MPSLSPVLLATVLYCCDHVALPPGCPGQQVKLPADGWERGESSTASPCLPGIPLPESIGPKFDLLQALPVRVSVLFGLPLPSLKFHPQSVPGPWV